MPKKNVVTTNYPETIVALWKNTSKGGKSYYTGTCKGRKVVGFANTSKKNPKEPDLRVYYVGEDGKAEKDECIAIWSKVSKNKLQYFSGKIEGDDKFIVGFKSKSTNEKAPYVSFIYSTPREDITKVPDEPQPEENPFL